MTVRATPAFRLIVDPAFADLPSRLVVLYARVETVTDDRLHFDPAQMRLVFPTGRQGKVFDAPRAAVLLHRTELARWELDYATSPGHPPGGLEKGTGPRLKEKIRDSLMTATEFGPDRALTGYLVVDTGVPVRSLEKATLEATTIRTRDAQQLRAAYQFAAQTATQP